MEGIFAFSASGNKISHTASDVVFYLTFTVVYMHVCACMCLCVVYGSFPLDLSQTYFRIHSSNINTLVK